MNRLLFLTIFFILQLANLSAGTIQGIRGPIYISSAWNLTKGDLVFHGHSRFYYKNEVSDLPGEPTSAVTFWDAQGALNLFYGIGKHYDIGISQVIYQDNHKTGNGYNFPDDLFLKVKAASFGPLTLPFNYGVQISSRIPLAKHHNIPFEPYSAGNVEFSILGLVSYSSNLLIPEDSFNAHVNIGYLDHNDADAEFNTSNRSSREFIYGAGVVYPIARFDFSFEFYGNRYLSRPAESVYSRYNYVYVTPGITYHPYDWLSVLFGLDYRLTSARPSETAQTVSPNAPVFPTWRVNFGARMNLISKIQERFTKKEDKSLFEAKTQDNNIYEQIATERKEVEEAERELESIREERKRMDDMLKRLRNILEYKEEEQKKDPEDK